MCLMARRMVERGVRYVQLINVTGTPTAIAREITKARRGKSISRSPDCLTDLERRACWKALCWSGSGEFGRTPIRQGSNGRDHHPYGFSAWMAGGGIVRRQDHRGNDDFGFAAVDDKVHVNDLHATMLGLMGVDHEKLTYLFEGRYRV